MAKFVITALRRENNKAQNIAEKAAQQCKKNENIQKHAIILRFQSISSLLPSLCFVYNVSYGDFCLFFSAFLVFIMLCSAS
jgi:hypothetical protein